jgi:hypothetical protein
MSGTPQVTYAVDFGGRQGRKQKPDASKSGERTAHAPIARVARLLALAIRLEGLIREQRIRDYAEAARLGGVTRARMIQIMKLLDLAPDIQEQILFLPPIPGLNERNLRPIANRIDWDEQRPLFQELARRSLGLRAGE